MPTLASSHKIETFTKMANKPTGPRITVVIPTRERCDVLESSLHTVTQQRYENLEILVSDNFSHDRTEEIVRGIPDPRIKYVNTGRRLSMSHNWEFALSQVTGDWVSVVGDDDGLLPDCLPRVADLIERSSSSAIQSATCLYRWPGHKKRAHGRIRIPMRSKVEVRDSEVWVERVLKGEATHLDLPVLYTGGFVKRTVLEKIVEKSGRLYNSRIPDVYSAFAIACMVPSYIYSYTPLAISGVSRHSTGTDQFSARSTSADSPSQKFFSEENLPFHPDIPLMEDGNVPSSLAILNLESYWHTSALRKSEPDGAAQRHLEVILATTDNETPGLLEWCKKFAAAHEADFEAALRHSHCLRVKKILPTVLANFERRRYRQTIGSPNLPILNVFEASLAAESFLQQAGKRHPI